VDGQSVVARGERVAYQRIDEGAVLLHLDTGAYHRVNAVGALIWEALEEHSVLDDVVREVERSLDGPVPDTLQADVQEFVESLIERSLIVSEAP
jgi:hypothetical protein